MVKCNLVVKQHIILSLFKNCLIGAAGSKIIYCTKLTLYKIKDNDFLKLTA